jgi:hypothetical protein
MIDEHIDVVQHPVFVDTFGIEHHIPATKGAKTTRFQQAELRFTQRFHANGLGPSTGCGYCKKRQPAEQQRDDHAQHADRSVQAARAQTTCLHRRHLAFVIQAAERQQDGKEKTDRHHHTEVPHRSQYDQRQHYVLGEIVGGSLRQHSRQLIGHQDQQQHASHCEPGNGHFAEDVAIQRAQNESPMPRTGAAKPNSCM